MKAPGIVLLLLLPVVAFAEEPAAMGDQSMQMMAQKLQEMQKCMQAIDKSEMAAIEKKSIQSEKQVKTLCSKGKRDQAQKKAMSFGKEISNLPAMKAMKKCTENMQGMPVPDQDIDFANQHVCDELGGRD